MFVEISVDDGHELDVRAIRLLDKHKLLGTFYVPMMSWGFDHLDVYRNHNIGNHTINHHSDIKRLDNKGLRAEICGAHRYLKENDIHPKKFCPPRGRYDDRVVRICKSLKYKQLRTTRVLCTTKSDELVQDTTIHAYQRNEYGETDWYDKAIEILDGKPEYFHLWYHSLEVDRDGNWGKLSDLLRMLSESKHSVGVKV